MDREGGRLLVVERAQPHVAVGPGFAQPHVFPHHVDDVDRGFQLLLEIHAPFWHINATATPTEVVRCLTDVILTAPAGPPYTGTCDAAGRGRHAGGAHVRHFGFDSLAPDQMVAAAVLPFATAMWLRLLLGRTQLTRWAVCLGTMWFAFVVLLAPYSAGLRQDLLDLGSRFR